MRRCIVCGAEPSSPQRTVSRTFGGGDHSSLIAVKLDYCADRSECGEAAAVRLIELLAAPFIAAEVRSDGVSSIEDLSEPDR